MAWACLDEHGAVTAVFGCAQLPPEPPGYAEIADDDPRIAAYLMPPIMPITRLQLRLWLWRNKRKTAADLDAAIAAIPDAGRREEAAIVWSEANRIDRNHPLVAQIGAAFKMSAGEIDAAFVEAASL